MMHKAGQNKNAASSQQLESSYRRKITNLEHEVDLIFAQEASDEEEKIGDEYVAKTQQQFSTPAVVLSTQPQTPRRSNRKSIKPAQDYADIVGRSCMRAEVKDNEETDKGDPAPKWTQMEVGRVSQKRGRKSRKTAEEKRNKIEVVNNVENDQLVVQENVPDDMKKQASNGSRELDQRNSAYKQNKNTMGANKEKVEMPPMKENFGAYLKSNKLNVSDSDLGLNPLSQDEDENGETITVETVQNEMTDKIENTVDKVECKKVDEKYEKEITNKLEQLPLPEESHEYTEEGKHEEKLQEMASGISFVLLNEVDQQDQDDKENELPANETFNASDCFIVTPADQPRKLSMEDDDMQPLQLSDDDEFDEVEPPEAKEAPRTVLTNMEDGMEAILTTPLPQQAFGTPQKRSKGYRFPTPYKAKGNLAFNTGAIENEYEDVGSNVIGLSVTTLEPKGIIQRSIRKRSLSVCINGDQATKCKQMRNLNRVTFYSPANQTLVIEEIDLLIAKSTKKAAEMVKDKNVTMRRKRSMSFDDSMMMNRCATKLPKPGFMHHITPIKSNQGGPSRTKLPNFAQIHQKNFNNMENLVDHVTRKAERAKILTNSVGRTLTASSHKGLSTRNQIDSTSKKKENPKALKKIDLLGIQTKPAPAPPAPPTAVEIEVENVASSLPNPQMAFIKPLQSFSSCTLASKKTVQKATPKRAPLSIKPRFNLSTLLLPKSVRQAAPIPVPAPLLASTSAPSDKIAIRRQRHMDMFKGRAAAGTHTDARNSAIIRGVRSNRRFDLQMQHRRNFDHN